MDYQKAQELWKALDLIIPKHNDGHKPPLCTDDGPNGGGNFGCLRCDLIDYLESKRRLKIWPRKEVLDINNLKYILVPHKPKPNNKVSKTIAIITKALNKNE
jgi:hypothetical protein